MRFNLIVNDWDRKAFLISHFSDTSYNMGGDIVTEDSVDMPWQPVLGAGCSWGEGGVRHGGGGGGQGGEGARPGDGGGGPGHGEVGAASTIHMVTSLPAAFSGSFSSGWRIHQVPCLDAAHPLLADIPQRDCSLETHYIHSILLILSS